MARSTMSYLATTPQHSGTAQEPIAVIGLSCLFPEAASAEEFWSNIRRGVDCIREIPETHWNIDDYFHADPKSPDRTYARRGGFLKAVDFDPLEFGISPNNLEAIDTSQLLGLVAAKRALDNAGYGQERAFNRSRVSCILGVTGTLEMVIPLGARLGHPHWKRALEEAGVAPSVAQDVIERISAAYVPWQENSFPGLLGNVVAGRIANKLDLWGTNCVVDAACASSLSALHLALLELQAGRSDMVLTGGVDTFNDIFMYMCFSKTPALSPTGDARPFSQNSDGTMLGEGVGLIVLKRLADAKRDGDRVLGVIRSVGTSSDGKGTAVYAPKAEGQIRCLEDAYQQAGISPHEIDLVEAHGTGTKVGDATEIKGLTTIFEAAARTVAGEEKSAWCAVGSVKSQVGHTKAAAGIASLIKVLLALHHEVLPPTIKVDQPADALRSNSGDRQSPFYVNIQSRPWLPGLNRKRRAGVSAFGFGGSNFHCVMEEAPAECRPPRQPGWDGQIQLLTFSGPDEDQLIRTINEFLAQVCRSPKTIRKLASQLRSQFRAQDLCRLTMVADLSSTDWQTLATRAIEQIVRTRQSPLEATVQWTLPEGVAYSRGFATGSIGLLFPGQGSQYPGMLRDLACLFPEMRDVLAAANHAFVDAPRTGNRAFSWALSDAIYPVNVWNDEARALAITRLKATDVAQPALGAVSLGGWRVLQRFGIRPTAVAGHSYGELTALCAAGRFSPEELYRLSMLRGQLMAEGELQPGGMLAIHASSEVVEQALRELNLELVIANHNSPSQVVISGRLDQITRAGELLGQRNLRGKQLAVAAAFHSPLVAQAAHKFRPALEQIPFHGGSIPVYANSSAKVYPQEADAARELLASQLARPVHFVDEIRAMYQSGVRTFIEVGPGHVLTGLVSSILSGQPHQALALDSSQGRRRGEWDLAWLLGQLAVSGHDLQLAHWDAPTLWSNHHLPEPREGTIPICGANYTRPKPPLPVKMKVPEPVQIPASSSDLLRANLTDVIRPTPQGPCEVVNSHASLVSAESSRPPEGYSNAAELSSTAASLNSSAFGLNSSEELIIANAPAHNAQIRQTLPLNYPVQIKDSSPVASYLETLQAIQQQTALAHQTFLAQQQQALQLLTQLIQHVPAASPNGSMTSPATQALAAPLPPAMPPIVIPAGPATTISAIPPVAVLPSAPPMITPAQPVVSAVVPAAVPVPVPAPVPVVAPPAGKTNSELAASLLEVVSEKTGYPKEMLQLKMSLDHDLGIDSIKRVEILSAMQERFPNLPAVSPEQLGSLQTLADVVAAYPQSTTGTAPAVAQIPQDLAPQEPTSSRSQTSSVGESNGLAASLLEVVAEKTGYPKEMLQLRMSLDHDLGIDSIKRVEILSAMQERFPNLPVVSPEQLGSLQTLADVVAAYPETTAAGAPENTHELKKNTSSDALGSSGLIVESTHKEKELPPTAIAGSTKAMPREVRFPEPHTLQRGLLKTVAIAPAGERRTKDRFRHEVWITDDGLGESGLSRALSSALINQGIASRIVPQTATLQGAPAVNIPDILSGLIILPSAAAQDPLINLWQNLEWLQQVSSALRKDITSGERRLLGGVVRLNGHFGVLDANAPGHIVSPESGGLTGLIKTARHEWPEVTARVFDIGQLPPSEAAPQLVEELLATGPLETGIAQFPGGSPVEVQVEWNTLDVQAASAQAIPVLTTGDLVVVSGGARGVTMEAALETGKALGTTMVLLGRTPPPELSATTNGNDQPLTEIEFRQQIMSENPVGWTPRMVADEARLRLAQQELRTNLHRFAKAGVRAVYRQLDVSNPSSVRQVLAEIVASMGPIRGLIHGAGVIADARIERKTREQFEDVMRVKVQGLKHLLAAIDPSQLRMLGLFSSFTGRYGRTGQADYAIANEILNKQARAWAAQHPECHVTSWNWGPWDGGMVNDQLRAIFAKEQVGLIPLREGASIFASEYCQSTERPVEIVVLAPVQPTAAASLVESETPIEKTKPVVASRQGFDRLLSVNDHPFLDDHVIGGKAVLPLAIMLEWIAHGAAHLSPGMALSGFENVKVMKGVRLSSHELAQLKVQLEPFAEADSPRHTSGWVQPWHARLNSEATGRTLLHATADVIMTGQTIDPPPLTTTNELRGDSFDRSILPADLYQEWLFHGPLMQGIEQVLTCNEQQVSVISRVAEAPRLWMHKPHRHSWLIDPLVLDVVFQMAIVWAWQQRGMPSLPTGIRRIELLQRKWPAEGVIVTCRIKKATAHVVSMDGEILNRQGQILARLEGVDSLMDASLKPAFAARSLSHGQLLNR
ncbi:type I polyketide synthase [Planctopirus ephydatiae]|nr:type I polyketide synthase [Planctopirus ephydatiae]